MNRAQALVDRTRTALPWRPRRTELRAELDRLPACTNGRHIVELRSRPMRYASSFAIEEVDLRFDDDTTLGLVCKGLGDEAILPEARGVRPHFLRNPLREIAVYESILEPLGLGAPRYYGQVIEPLRGRYWLFLERIAGQPLTEVGEFDVWRQVSSFLARLHGSAALRAHSEMSGGWVPLVRYDAAFHRRWMKRALSFHGGAFNASAARVRLEWLASRYEAIVDEIDALVVGFVHGEFYASNVLIESAADGIRVRPLDWELAGIGSPLMDLAALTAGWAEDCRRELVSSYYSALDEHAAHWLPLDAFCRALDCCRVQLAVRCLGWAQRWTPPDPHTQDWLGEAVLVAERIAGR